MNEFRNGGQKPQRRRPGIQSTATRQRQNGPGNAQKAYERYLQLAREATVNGDIIEAENCFQHAEHYFRVGRER